MGQKRSITDGQVFSTGKEKEREISFVASTPDRDRYGTVLNQDNWELENYRENPIVLYHHQSTGDNYDPDVVIGKSSYVGIEVVDGRRCLVATIEFEPAEINPLAEKVYLKTKFGSLSAVSVGFLPVGKGSFGKGDEAREGSNPTFYFEGQELLEISVVPIPANPNAGVGKRKIAKDAYAVASRSLGIPAAELHKYSHEKILQAIDSANKGRPTPQGPQTKVNNTLKTENMELNSLGLFERIRQVLQGGSYKSLLTAQARKELAAARIVNAPLSAITLPHVSRAVLGPESMASTQPVFPVVSVENAMVIPGIGALYLDGLVNNTVIPNLSGIEADFLDTFDEDTPNLDSKGILMDVRRITAYLCISDSVPGFISPAADIFLINAINQAIGLALERGILASSAGSTYRPQGMGYACTLGEDTAVASAAPTLEDINELEDSVLKYGMKPGEYAFITSPSAMRTLMAMVEAESSAFARNWSIRAYGGILNQDRGLVRPSGFLNGYPVYVTSNAPVNLGTEEDGVGLYFGNWSRLVIGKVGPTVLTFDPLTRAKSGMLKIWAHAWYDVKGLDGKTPTSEGSVTQDYNFKGFGVLPILIEDSEGSEG